jgi:membrane protease YdiL (CAAX protease family)
MPRVPSQRLIRMAALLYTPLLVSAAWVRPRSLLAVGPERAAQMALGLGVAAAGAVAVVLASRAASRRTAWGRALRAELGALLGGLSSRELLALALLSGFGEEFLFRGIALHYWGVWGQGLAFGGCHWPVRRALWPWTLFALAMGLALGWLTRWSGSLWPAVLLHFSVNYFNLHDLAEAPPPAAPPEG